MQIEIKDNIGNLKKEIEAIIKKTVFLVKQYIDLKEIKITVKKTDSSKTLKHLSGVGAYCPNSNFVQISLDTEHKDLKNDLETPIKKSLIHELHHVARRQSDIEIDTSSVLECIFSEGLADYLVYTITKTSSKWIINLKPKDKKRLLLIIRRIQNDKATKQLYKDWFISGSQKNKIPKWSGYAIGYEIAKNFIEKNTKYSIKQITTKSVQQLNVRI